MRLARCPVSRSPFRPTLSVYTFSHSFRHHGGAGPRATQLRPGPSLSSAPYPLSVCPRRPASSPLPQADNLIWKGQGPASGSGHRLGYPGFRREQGAQLARIGLPVLLVQVDKLEQYPATFRYLGKIFGKPQRGEALASYIDQASQRLQQATTHIAPQQRLRPHALNSWMASPPNAARRIEPR